MFRGLIVVLLLSGCSVRFEMEKVGFEVKTLGASLISDLEETLEVEENDK